MEGNSFELLFKIHEFMLDLIWCMNKFGEIGLAFFGSLEHVESNIHDLTSKLVFIGEIPSICS